MWMSERKSIFQVEGTAGAKALMGKSMPWCLRIGEEACVAAEVHERKREQEEVRSEVTRERVGSEGGGVLKEGVEADTILRKGEKRAQKIKWLPCGVNSSTAMWESGHAGRRGTWREGRFV